MAIKDTSKHLRDLLTTITHDLEKAENGNKAASQRVRTGTVKLEKIAKLYRKESIKTEKSGVKSPRKSAAKKSSSASKAKKSSVKSVKSVAKKAPVKSVAKKAPVKSKAKKPAVKASGKATARARALSFKKPTAKLPVRSWR